MKKKNKLAPLRFAIGITQQWNDGIEYFLIKSSFQYSKIPSFQV